MKYKIYDEDGSNLQLPVKTGELDIEKILVDRKIKLERRDQENKALALVYRMITLEAQNDPSLKALLSSDNVRVPESRRSDVDEFGAPISMEGLTIQIVQLRKDIANHLDTINKLEDRLSKANNMRSSLANGLRELTSVQLNRIKEIDELLTKTPVPVVDIKNYTVQIAQSFKTFIESLKNLVVEFDEVDEKKIIYDWFTV